MRHFWIGALTAVAVYFALLSPHAEDNYSLLLAILLSSIAAGAAAAVIA